MSLQDIDRVKREAWLKRAREEFSVVGAKRRRRQANAARKGVAPRPTAQMGWNRGTDDLIREVLRGPRKDDERAQCAYNRCLRKVRQFDLIVLRH